MKKSTLNKILISTPIILILILSCNFSNELRYSDLEPIISVLQNISSMVFTIMGIWIAYIYPNAILKITQPSKIDAIYSEEDEKRVQIIVGTVILSAAVLALLMLGITFKTLLLKTNFYNSHPFYFKLAGVFILLNLVYVQFLAIYIVIASNVNFIIDLRNKKIKRDLDDKF